MSPEPTGSPAARSSRANRTSTPTSGACRMVAAPSGGAASGTGACSGTGGDLRQVVAHHVQVVAFLHHRADGVLRGPGVQVGLAEEVQGADPVDRLGHPGRLG